MTNFLHVNAKTTLHGDKQETKNFYALRIPKSYQNMQENSRTDTGRFSGLDQRRMVRNSDVQTNEKWDHVAEDMMLNFSESGHPVFRGSSTLERRDLESTRKKEICLIHFCGDDGTAEVVFRTIISVNQLSIYGCSGGHVRRTDL